MISAMSELRARTAYAHASVDVTFGAYDLTDRSEYLALLRAHARALPVLERLMMQNVTLPRTRPRSALLMADLAALGHSMPAPMVFGGSSQGAGGWGILYVVEGSRLGGGVLARRVGTRLPTSYLADIHEPGEWRKVGAAIDTAAMTYGPTWLDQAIIGAEACFELYRRAASSLATTPAQASHAEGVMTSDGQPQFA
jgi:heme oxygenase